MKFKYLQDNHNYLVSHHDSRRYMFLKHKSDLCLGCADSDLKIPKEIQNKIIQTARKGDFSYCYQDLKLFKLINNFFYQKYNLTFNSENFLIGSGVINLIQIWISVICKKGDTIITNTPSYPPFLEVGYAKGINCLKCPLLFNKKTADYAFDFQLFEKQSANPKVKAFLFCNPHNPTGKVWNLFEIKKIILICKKNNVFIISDEIWSEIIFSKAQQHTMLEADSERVVVISSFTKTYNVGSAHMGFSLTFNKHLNQLARQELHSEIHYSTSNRLGCSLFEAAYGSQTIKKWLKEYICLLEWNTNYIRTELTANTNLIVTKSHATNLVWVNFSKYQISEQEMENRLARNGIFGAKGSAFGLKPNEFFIRFAVGLMPNLTKELVWRLVKEFS